MYLNFHSLEVVSRYRETQLRVPENYNCLRLLCMFCLSETSSIAIVFQSAVRPSEEVRHLKLVK